MSDTIRNILNGKWENHVMPFFWQHGEDEATLRKYMEAIDKANCGAVCVESRPHPDFCGPKWWRDMDVILDEARKRGMKVWILDDSHFPTGFANGAVKSAPLELHRQSVCANKIELAGEARTVSLELAGLIPPEYKPMGVMEQFALPGLLKDAPRFEDDQVIALTAVNHATGEQVYIPYHGGERTDWQKPAGDWTVWVIGLSRNAGVHREYMNMLDPAACRLLIDAVYEPHWQHYQSDFGKTIAGFFSDEPELGNGHLFWFDNVLGADQDLPFSATLPKALEARLGEDWANKLYLLWTRNDEQETAFVRHAYMDAVTKLVRESFSRQVGSWCREHGVQYIGHLIEDGNAHARTGASLGHYFRGLDGQDMAGIDDIGGQVMPQGEDGPTSGMMGQKRDGEFYHYMMGNLAASAAAIEPGKHGDAMCEIFGAYGWSEGVRLEKYLADHFMVRGVNQFVPHAFSAAPFPDPDCPPHFYAHGHNPQYRHFGAIMNYMNRVSTLISGGRRASQAAVLYHGEAEWAGEAMLTQKPARKLFEAQIEFDTVPCDVFAEPEHYRTKLGTTLQVNTQQYKALIVPRAQYLPLAAAKGISALIENGFPVFFIDAVPEGVSDSGEAIPENWQSAKIVTLEELVPALKEIGAYETIFTPANPYLRAMHYQGKEELFYFVNEGAETWSGTVQLPVRGDCFFYDAWENRASPAEIVNGKLALSIEPLKSVILVMGKAEGLHAVPSFEGKAEPLSNWTRSTCESIAYPAFKEQKAVTLPDALAEEQPEFSGFVRYETTVQIDKAEQVLLEITDAWEGVEVFLNGQSAGIQVAPPFRYDISKLVRPGENEIVIEVATTLERWSYSVSKDDPRAKVMGLTEPTCGSGITGTVKLFCK